MSEIDLYLWESLEEFIYRNCNKNTFNLDEYENKFGINLRKYIDIQGIKTCIEKLNKTDRGEISGE